VGITFSYKFVYKNYYKERQTWHNLHQIANYIMQQKTAKAKGLSSFNVSFLNKKDDKPSFASHYIKENGMRTMSFVEKL